jgi:type I restriction enzyme S subunit
LGEVPEHWEVARLKHSVEACKNGVWGAEPLGDENDIACVRVADFDRVRLRAVLDNPTIRNVTDSERASRLLRCGDLLLEKSGGGEKQPVGCVVLYDEATPAVCSNFIARMQLQAGQNPSFWRYLHAALYALGLTRRCINQTSGIQNLDQGHYLDELVGYPPLPEQQAIATFLDRETARIDALIGEQQRLIALLTEKRQAVISHAVTKGLDPTVPMKDSGVAWLGEVPGHWEVKRLKHLGEAIIGLTYSPDDVTNAQSGTLILRSSNVQMGQIAFDDNVYVAADIPPSLFVRPGDILICSRNGSRSLIGKNAVIGPDAVGASFGAFMTIFRSDFNRYLRHIFNSKIFEFQAGAFMTATINQLTVSTLYGMEVPVPPLPEQTAIATYLDQEINRTDALIADANQAITLLQERRAALITAAVTGQIDVRAHAEALPA